MNSKQYTVMEKDMDIKQRMNWDTENGQILDENRRYILLRADVLMGIFTSLDSQQKQAALQSFQQSVYKNGNDSVQAYWQEIKGDSQQLLTSMMSISAQLGWGVWSVQEQTSERLIIHVRNSPFAQASKAQSEPICYAIVGIIEAMGQLIFNTQVHVFENQCAAHQSSPSVCSFTITPLLNAN